MNGAVIHFSLRQRSISGWHSCASPLIACMSTEGKWRGKQSAQRRGAELVAVPAVPRLLPREQAVGAVRGDDDEPPAGAQQPPGFGHVEVQILDMFDHLKGCDDIERAIVKRQRAVRDRSWNSAGSAGKSCWRRVRPLRAKRLSLRRLRRVRPWWPHHNRCRSPDRARAGSRMKSVTQR